MVNAQADAQAAHKQRQMSMHGLLRKMDDAASIKPESSSTGHPTINGERDEDGKTRSERMREAGFTPRDTRLTCDSCGQKFSALMLPIHKCSEGSPTANLLKTADLDAFQTVWGAQE